MDKKGKRDYYRKQELSYTARECDELELKRMNEDERTELIAKARDLLARLTEEERARIRKEIENERE